MKKYILRLMLFTSISVASLSVNSQPQDPPPPPADGHGQSTDQLPGGGAPLGTGIGILLALGGAYGAKKVYDIRKKTKE